MDDNEAKDDFFQNPRFAEPQGWRWHFFRSASGHEIRFGSVFPAGDAPDAVVVCLPGFREFAEKYFETAHDMLARNHAFWVMDWAGQGGSERFLSNTFKAHSVGFDKNIADLRQFLVDYVKPAAVDTDKGRLPVVLIGHSMGGHIGLRYLHDNPEDLVRGAAFTTPMIRIRQFEKTPEILSSLLSHALRLRGQDFVRGAERLAATARAAEPGKSTFSSDSVRDALQTAWFSKEARLQVTGPTNGWLSEALRSCAKLQKPLYLEAIKPPVLLAIAGQDMVVSPGAIRNAAKHMPDCEVVEFSDARHEVLMERDEIRDAFLSRFDGFMDRKILSRPDRLIKF